MRNTIAIGLFGLALFAGAAAAQTTAEQARILGDFHRSVMDDTNPAPKVFTLPVAMVFRQLIARTLAAPAGAAIAGTTVTRHATLLQPLPATGLFDLPKLLSDALPLLPAPLEYRLIGNDLVIRDAQADVIVAVLRDALGSSTTR